MVQAVLIHALQPGLQPGPVWSCSSTLGWAVLIHTRPNITWSYSSTMVGCVDTCTMLCRNKTLYALTATKGLRLGTVTW